MSEYCRKCVMGDVEEHSTDCMKHPKFYEHHEAKDELAGKDALIDELLDLADKAMIYIDECPCDPDIYKTQWEAWQELQKLNPRQTIAKIAKHRSKQ